MAPAPPQRKIIHVDMDAFFAAVEQRDNPDLRGLPVIVGGSVEGRGVVATASYEARRFGVHSAMSAARARKLCPQGVFLRGDYEKYARISREVRAILLRYTSLLEPLSLDEAYLDVTANKPGIPSATHVAEALRERIREELRLTASAGVGPNKLVAKIASDARKPDGLCVVPPGAVRAFMQDLPVRKIPGVGPALDARCRRFGLRTCGDVLEHDEETLVGWFGSTGAWLLHRAAGHDNSPVATTRLRKSCGIEDTFPRDLQTREEAREHLAELARGLQKRLEAHGLRGRTLTLKVKFNDFQQITRSRTLHDPVWTAGHMLAVVEELLRETEVGRRPVRLLGLAVSHLEEVEPHQLLLPFYRELLQSEDPGPR